MISYQLKRLYYLIFSPIMALNAFIYKILRAPGSGNNKTTKVQLGPGKNNYLAGWINLDSNLFTAKTDVWANISSKLPFRDDSVDIYYSHHVVEHLEELELHFHEMFRTLKKGGKIRVGGPNGDSAIAKFIENDLAWFPDFPDKKSSIGGRFENFVFCRKEHLTILTRSYLEEIASNAGFRNIRFCLLIKETNFPECINEVVLQKEWESDFNFPHTIIIEAEKPL